MPRKNKSGKSAKSTSKAPTPAHIIRDARDNPWGLFTAHETAIILRRSTPFVLAAKNLGAPFPGGVTRPEWVLEWLRANPGFVVKANLKKPKKGKHKGNGRRNGET